MDPYEVLGVRPGSAEADVVAAYRAQAKRWHPDRAGAEGAEKMAEINAAYDLLRAAEQQTLAGLAQEMAREAPDTKAKRPGHWLAPALRVALGRELLDHLMDQEDVKLVTPASTWASPRAILAVTDRRLLWLLDDAPVARVHSIPFRGVSEIKHRVRRKRARLMIRTLAGRRHVFHDLRPHTAATIERLVTA
jgi:hypothetical protein